MSSDDVVHALRQALAESPDNLPLRAHLAQTLVQLGRYDEAEREYRHALKLAPDDPSLKLALAQVFFQAGKLSHASVLIEDLLKIQQPPARAYVLHARLLLRAGDVNRAVSQYRRALEDDPGAADAELSARLGVRGGDEANDVVDGKVRLGEDASEAPAGVEFERPAIAFRDVGGMEALKEEIRLKIIYPLQHADLYRAYGKTAGGGILMYGPPGCGKTHLARATAGEIKASFLAVGINDVLEMWLGNSERNLHEVFEQARRHRPCVLFFDEVDALAASRADMRQSAGRQLINQFLAELDGMQSSNEGVLVLAATNAPWHIDPAFRRPGRFDRILFVPPPDVAARTEILRLLLGGKPVSDIDHQELGKRTDQFSGADLKAMVDVAIEAKLRAALKEGIPRPLTTKDLLAAAATVRASTREWFSTARNYALYSNQGGIYDDILKYLKIA